MGMVEERSYFSEPVDERMRIARRWGALLAVAVLLIMVVPNAIGAVQNAETSATTPRAFYIGMGESVTSANPFVGIYDSDYLFYSYVYDYLTFPNEDGVATPNLAKSWWHMDGSYAAATYSDFSTLSYHQNPSDWPLGSIWEYNLTENIFWNDGEPFTADDVVYTIRIQTGTGYINYWAYQPYTKWIERCEKINDYKVRIYFADRTTHNPIPAAWAASMSIPMMPNHIFSEFTDAYIAQNWNGIPAIGTGPFMGTPSLPSEMIAKESITLVRNPYWNFTENGIPKGLGGYYNRTIQIDKLIMKFYAEEQTLIVDLKTQKLDASEVTPTNYFALKTNKPAALTMVSLYSSTVYSKISHFNVNDQASASLNPTRLDPALLRATAVATNKSYICDVIYKGLATPGVGILSPVWPQYYWSPPHNEVSTFNVTDGSGNVKWSYTKPLDEVMSFNLTLANEILDEAGYVWTDASHTLRKVGPDAADRLVNLGIVGDASAALGKTLEFEDVYEIEVYEDKDTCEYLMSEWAHIGVKLTQKPVNVGVWVQLVYGFQYTFTETYWSGDVDPNYLLYIPTSYAMDGWNEFGTRDPNYDALYSLQASELNPTTRQHWIDECQKWQYLEGGAMIFTAYPKTCYAYNDGVRWTNWGNWTQHPGLAIDHFWGETPLFYHITSGPPSKPVARFTIAPSTGTTETVITFNASSCSDSQDPIDDLQVRWDWQNDGVWDTNWTENKTASYQYLVSGNYTVKLEVKNSHNLVNYTTHYVIVTGGSGLTSSFALIIAVLGIFAAVVVGVILYALIKQRRGPKPGT
jgi:peptide/nickel transport system substrate-binding protein